VQITGLGSIFARRRFVFGSDALQALQLAMELATVTLETFGHGLEWLGQREYDATVELVNIAMRDASGGLTADAIAQRGGHPRPVDYGFRAMAAGDAWTSVRGRACQP
jgi:hypothetical protein